MSCPWLVEKQRPNLSVEFATPVGYPLRELTPHAMLSRSPAQTLATPAQLLSRGRKQLFTRSFFSWRSRMLMNRLILYGVWLPIFTLLTSPGTAADVLTYHNDQARTGWNQNESALAPDNVS